MLKQDIIDRLSETMAMSKHAAGRALETMLDQMATSLLRGEEVRLKGFGALSVRERKASEGRNPRTGEKIKIAAKKTIGFRTSKALAQRLNG